MKSVAVLLSCLLLSACIAQPIGPDESHAQLKSWARVVTIDGAAPESPYLSNIEPGFHTVVIVYRTYQRDYRCTFEFEAAAAVRYEIVDHNDPQPLTLYRWHRRNALWSVRLDPVPPKECTEEI
jgi:hypothetical protein